MDHYLRHLLPRWNEAWLKSMKKKAISYIARMKNDEKHQLKWAELSINDEDCHTICMGVYSET